MLSGTRLTCEDIYINQYLDTWAEWGQWTEMKFCKAFNGTCGSILRQRISLGFSQSSPYSIGIPKGDFSKIERCSKFDKCGECTTYYKTVLSNKCGLVSNRFLIFVKFDINYISYESYPLCLEF